MNRPLLLVGCGKMGGAMLSGWRESGIAAAGVTVVEPAGAPEFAAASSFEGRSPPTFLAPLPAPSLTPSTL